MANVYIDVLTDKETEKNPIGRQTEGVFIIQADA